MKKVLIINLFVLMILNFSCQTKQPADLIVKNAVIYSVDPGFSKMEAMAIKDGKILALGSSEDILNGYHSENEVDAGGNPVYPGFIDGHCHFYGFGLGLIQQADLTGTASFEEVIQVLQNFHEKHPYVWITGRGWDQNDWEVKEFPDKTLLDKLFPTTPVMLTRIDGHAILVNSEALRRAGINEDTKIPGGDILKKNGELTGILLDNAIDTLRAAIPAPKQGQMTGALLEAQDKCFSVGLTSVVDAGLDLEVINLIDSMQQSGSLKMRIDAMVTPKRENLDIVFEKGPYSTDRLRVGSLKFYIDGALGSRGALMLEPYSDDPGNYGLLLADTGYFREMFQEAYENGFQVNTHSIGDSACRIVLNLYGELLKGKNDQRWRIEHAQVMHPDDFKLFAKYSVIPSIQSTHATSDMFWAAERLGEDRIRYAYAFKDLLEQNGWVVNGTDFPVEEIDPLQTFYASVARKDRLGRPEGGFQMENALGREETLKSMTIWAAKGSFEENRKGSLEPGKVADFVILDRDIMTIPGEELLGVKVLETYSGGEKVYDHSTHSTHSTIVP